MMINILWWVSIILIGLGATVNLLNGLFEDKTEKRLAFLIKFLCRSVVFYTLLMLK